MRNEKEECAVTMPPVTAPPAAGADMRLVAAVKSAGRVLEILEFFSEIRRPATVDEVCKALSYPQSSTSVLLRSMQQLGYLAFDPVHRGYHPTVRVAILGGWLNEALAPKGSVTNIMEELRRRTGETIILALQNGIYAQYASILLGTSPERIYIRIGALKPICRAAVGKALLAGKSRSEIALLVRRINAEADTPEDHVDVAALLEDIAHFRQRGFTRSLGSVRPLRDVIATTLFVPEGQPPLAIGVGGPLQRMNAIRDDVLKAFDDIIGPKRV